MALHDPDSTIQEKAIALKIGRQKKIQIIDGQQVVMMIMMMMLLMTMMIYTRLRFLLVMARRVTRRTRRGELWLFR